MVHIAFILLLLGWIPSASCTEWQFSSAQETAILLDQLDTPFFLDSITYNSDVQLSPEEFHYLTGLHESTHVSAAELVSALAYLFQKNVYDTITLSLTDASNGKTIHFDMNGFWRFEKIKVTGLWVGKEWYKQFYLMEPGDRFDKDKHRHSLHNMKEACRADGFFEVTAKSSFTYNQCTKGVTVHTALSRGTRFVIRSNRVRINAEQLLDDQECALLQKQLRKKIAHVILHTKYAKKEIEEQTKELKRFLAHKGFLHVSIDVHETVERERHAIHLEWVVTLHKKRDFIFFGNHFFSSAHLLEQVLQFGRSSFIVPASILAQEIKQAYQCKGFWDIGIDARDEDERSFFIIKEGARAAISHIAVKGVSHFLERTLIKRCFSKVKRHAVFDRELIEQAKDLLLDMYLKEGFLDCAIERHECVADPRTKKHTLIVSIKEGEQTVIDAVSIPSYESFEHIGPFAALSGPHKPWPYDGAVIQEQKRFLYDQLQKEGYLFPALHHEVVKEGDCSLLVWHIKPGTRVRFGKTIVQTDSPLPFNLIMRELQYEESDMWSTEKLKHSFARLKELNLFESISFTPLPLKEGEVARDVLLKLQKDDPFELRVRAGFEFQYIRQYQTFAGVAYKVGGTFMVKNVSNHGDFFRFDADVARSHREVRMKYNYPWLFGKPLDGLLHGYGMKYEQPGFIGSKRNLYTLYQNGFLCGVHHKNSYLDAAFHMGFEVGRTAFSDDDLQTRAAAIRLARAINFDPALLDRKIPYFFFEPTIMIDLLDNNLSPTRGAFTLLSCKGMFPTKGQFTNAYFFKFLIEQSWFIPLHTTVAAFRFRFGHIFHRQFCEIMPNERFYLGGSHSVRSYSTDLAPPTSEFIDDDCKKHAVPRGGKTMFNINGEFRIPVAKKAGVVLFQDAGILVGDSLADFCADNLVAGTGFGLRFFTPIGPLRFDIAWKWRKDRPDERGLNWVLTFGQAF